MIGQNQTSNIKHQSGLTLVEVIVVLALFAAVVSLTAVAGLDSYTHYNFWDQRDAVISALQKARGQAANNICLPGGIISCVDGVAHGVYFEPGKYVIFQGAAYNAGDTANEAITTDPNINISSRPLPYVQFSQLAATSTGATISISDDSGHSATTTVNFQGEIDW